jgi:hypothetical protein
MTPVHMCTALQVTKDQQTWRAEYKGGDAPPAATTAATLPKPVAAKATSAAAKAPTAPPRLEFLKAGNKWCVEHQTKVNALHC